MRTAQHLDPLDIVNIEHGSLGGVEIDVVDIEPDASLETRDRILLADAADKGCQRRIRTAADFQREVGNHLADFGELQRAARDQVVPAERSDRNRHVDQPLFPAPGGDDDLAAFCRQFDFVIGHGLGVLRKRGGRHGSERCAGHENGDTAGRKRLHLEISLS